MNGSRWTEEEIQLLKKLYPIKFNREIASILGRSIYSIEKQANRLGLKKKPIVFKKGTIKMLRKNEMKPWSKKDIEKLKRLYPNLPTDEVAKILGRTVKAVKHKAYALGIKKQRDYFVRNGKKINRKRWTDEEIKILRELYPKESAKSIAKKLGRPVNSIWIKAERLGLTKGHNKRGNPIHRSRWQARAYRTIVLAYFNNRCQICGCSDEKRLEVHHIDGNIKNNRLENLTLLCIECHRAISDKYKKKILGEKHATKAKLHSL